MDWSQIGLWVMGIYGCANIIARLTPTKEDDLIVGKVGKFLNAIFLASKIKKG